MTPFRVPFLGFKKMGSRESGVWKFLTFRVEFAGAL